MSSPILGRIDESAQLGIDLDRLIGSHSCIVANTGGGKSGLIRRLLEVTHGRVQHIVLDGEDEFYTLRERFDYVIAGGDGADVPARAENAPGLAVAALRHGFSLIAQINDLGFDGAPDFVGAFLEALIAAPRELWRPVLVVVDEAQRFVPRQGTTGATPGVKALVSQGRKRGFTAVLAGTKLTDIDPSVRAQCNNWMLGRVGQDLDRRAMAAQLGFAPADVRKGVLTMDEREFWAVGPALSRDPVRFRVADVVTTPVRSGHAKPATPPAPEALREILAGLAEEARKPEGQNSGNPADTDGAIGAMLKERDDRIAELETKLAEARRLVTTLEKHRGLYAYRMREIRERAFISAAELDRYGPSPIIRNPESHAKPGAEAEPENRGEVEPGSRPAAGRSAAATSEHMEVTAGETAPPAPADLQSPASEDREYRALAGLATVYPAGLTEAAWAARTGYSRKGGAWIRRRKRYLDAGLVELRDGQWFAKPAGVERAGEEVPDMPPPGPELVEWWAGRLGAPGRLLKLLSRVVPHGLGRGALAAEAGMSAKGGAFTRHVTALKRSELAIERGKRLFLSPALLGENS